MLPHWLVHHSILIAIPLFYRIHTESPLPHWMALLWEPSTSDLMISSWSLSAALLSRSPSPLWPSWLPYCSATSHSLSLCARSHQLAHFWGPLAPSQGLLPLLRLVTNWKKVFDAGETEGNPLPVARLEAPLLPSYSADTRLACPIPSCPLSIPGWSSRYPRAHFRYPAGLN